MVRVAEETIVRIGQVPRHLGHPLFVWLTRHAGDCDRSGLELYVVFFVPSTVKKPAAASPPQ